MPSIGLVICEMGFKIGKFCAKRELVLYGKTTVHVLSVKTWKYVISSFDLSTLYNAPLMS